MPSTVSRPIDDDDDDHYRNSSMQLNDDPDEGEVVSSSQDEAILEHKHGSILHIELENFMTYSRMEYSFGPGLNLVLGPNGSGKSALVCSLILGFAGDPQATGRSNNLAHYVRSGQQSATITIDIKNSKPGEGNYRLQREINITKKNGREECHTSWFLNGKGVTKATIVEFVKELQVDVNNFCQILPQEKVGDFSRLSPRQLLLSTEKSIGDTEMLDRHLKLIEWTTKITDLEMKIKEAKTFISKFQDNQEGMESDITALREKKKFEDEIKWLKKKKVWLEFEEKRLELGKIQVDFNRAKEEYEEFERSILPIKKNVEETQKAIGQLKTERIKVKSKTLKINDKLGEISYDINKCQDDASGLLLVEREKESQFRRLTRQLSAYEQDLENFQNDLMNHPKSDDFDKKLQELSDELKKNDTEYKKCATEMHVNENKMKGFMAEKNYYERQLKKIGDLFASRLAKAPDTDAKAAYEWLQNNRNMFRGEVFPPLITQIDVMRTDDVKYVESIIGSRELSTFLFDDANDLQLFSSELKKQLNIRVNMALIPEPDNRSDLDIEPYRQYGIRARVSDLFKAPEKVMTYLIKNHHLNQIPVGDSLTESKIYELIENSPIRKVLTPRYQYVTVVSHYNNEKSTRIVPLPPARFLNIIIDEEEQKKARDSLEKINESIVQCQADLDSYKKEYERLSEISKRLYTERGQLTNKKNAISEVEARIKAKKIQINQIKQDLERIESDNESLAPKLQQLQKRQIDLLQIMAQLLEQGSNGQEEDLIIESKIEILRQALEEFEGEKARMDGEEQFQRQQLDKAKERVQRAKIEAREFRERAKRESGFDFNADTDPAIKEKIEKLPDTLREVEDSITKLSIRCQGIRKINEAVIEQYQRCQRDIKDKTELSMKLEAELADTMEKVDRLKPIWIKSLQDIIGKINQNFAEFMAHLNYCGEVYLCVGKKSYTFDDYGIGIKVKFRDADQLKELNDFHQSGGERSVSTMLYMLALQELAHVPFRVVDEINQGMDERNERAVFDLIGHVSRKNSSQYFLLSPKLVPNLNFSRDMKIHIIFNGEYSRVDFSKIFAKILQRNDA